MRSIGLALQVRAHSDRFDEVIQIAPGLLDGAIAAGEIACVPYLRFALCEAQFRAGDWDGAMVTARQTIRESAAQANVITEGSAAAVSAWIACFRGDEAAFASSSATLNGVAQKVSSQQVRQFFAFTKALEAFVAGDMPRAAEVFGMVVAANDRSHGTWDPSRGFYWPFIVEALLAVDRRAEAERAGEMVRTLASRSRNPISLAMADFIDAMLGSGDPTTDQQLFESALPHDSLASVPILRAEYLHAYGAWTRVAGRLEDARTLLRESLDIYTELGAEALARRTNDEIRRAGGRRRRKSDGPMTLSERERDVADAVVRGLTNREIASALFVSVKTVEAHLSRLYGKLSVRNRAELIRTLTKADSPTRRD